MVAGSAVRRCGIDRIALLQAEQAAPGCTAAHRFAVDSARPGRLNAFAVFAFCAEITRLPGH
jgi:hypothetical protein